MYISSWQEKEEFWGAPCYRTESELIEADGEAEELFLQQCVDNQEVNQMFTAIDDYSEEQIELDITDYIGQKAFVLFDKCVTGMDEGVHISYTRMHSMYMACVRAKL